MRARAARGRTVRAAALLALALASGCRGGGARDPTGLAQGFETLAVSGGATLAYRVVGEGEPPLLAAAASFAGPDLEALARHRRLVLYDARGQGRSSRLRSLQDLSLERDVQDLESLRRHLGLERFGLLGWSYHGAVAASYAWLHPERVSELVLVAPLPPRREPYWRRLEAAALGRMDEDRLRELALLRASGLPRKDPAAFCRAFGSVVLAAYVADPLVLGRMRGDPCAPPNDDPDWSTAQSERRLRGLGSWDFTGDLEELRVPALVLQGEQDPTPEESATLWAELLPDARLVLLERCGHLPWLERPQAFVEAVVGFLEREPR